MTKENKQPNHLINEKSPYLLQHAYNPVDWYPWCEEAFVKAKSEDKPIFLSIGYSTCHWCHVMERESFEDTEVADYLNAHFISIKVDKEERPDVDTIYMNVCQAMNGHGGWPLTILMTPEQKPFYAGTYLPKHSRGQMLGLMELLQAINKMWQEDKERIQGTGDSIVEQLRRASQNTESDEEPSKQLFGTAYLAMKQSYDSKYGGFGRAPKFPTPHNLMFLLRYAATYQDKKALAMVEGTLNGMFQGGIYDHIGGGFSRYSTDDQWLVPHFEKMLYDNALLVLAYAEAYQVTKNELYAYVIQETLQYVMAEMTDECGGFYCAQDADSEGEEGKYYVFTPEEIKKVLGEEDGTWFNETYQITKQGNFEGANIPNLIGRAFDLNEIKKKKESREKLYQYRLGRMKLHKDDKILTSWNSLMIMAFAKAYQVLGNEFYLAAAKKAYAFINQTMRDENNRLYIRYREGHRYGLGNLEDYAFFSLAQIYLYEASFDPAYLLGAVKDAKEMIRLFWDKEAGGFYFYGNDAEHLIICPKEVYDGAIPSGNSAAAYVVAKLEKFTRDDEFSDIARRQFKFLAAEIGKYPSAYTFALSAMMIDLLEGKEVVCVLRDELDLDELQQLLMKYFIPNTVVIPIESHTEDGLKLVAPYIGDYKRSAEESQFYVCENGSCQAPFSGIERLKEYFEKDKF
ncbi:MAG: thioredoxin domain-containing protein [bacterium]|nr:thioredoxin domain-containing protein [bacterium]